MASINRNGYRMKNQFQCSYGHLTVVIRNIWKIVDLSFNVTESGISDLISFKKIFKW